MRGCGRGWDIRTDRPIEVFDNGWNPDRDSDDLTKGPSVLAIIRLKYIFHPIRIHKDKEGIDGKQI